MSFYTFARSAVKGILSPVYRFEVVGAENVPSEGGVIVCSNHIDNLDPPAVGITCPRPVSFMAKEELFKLPLLKSILPKLEAFPVRRGMSDREALRKGLGILKEGKVLGLFPEGTRSKDGKLGKGLAGVGFFALRSEAAVVPCAVIGPYRKFKKVKVVYGEPIDLTTYKQERASAEVVTDVIMSKIAELLDKHQ
ncbi:lysophospholipid acyltransferase family protein [Priestia koreensis]|uniref:lysophospholipid acyltransferase family protein n=1 Tax=Priestia koreensis TaxID=284581 RepID=UPI001F55EA98|nr:lysophospholipid acyltransferase family protein [Priestia koreensis]MCM3003934.1 1-acyl-sn-glycerol-3-phosphate acyltransferase [Priestia koreensis]UNL84032.1 1-acyl-sn-glycerol-3-phosphate acyltransferase [Priestia koreensis]